MSKSNRVFKIEKRRKELKRQEKKEKKMAKRLDKEAFKEKEHDPGLEEQKKEAD